MKKAPLHLIVVFVISSALAYGISLFFKNFDIPAFLTINLVLLLINLIIFQFQKKSIQSQNPHPFVRAIMGGMMLKMFIFITSIVIYVFAADGKYSIPTIAGILLNYLLYLIVEVRLVLSLNKKDHV